VALVVSVMAGADDAACLVSLTRRQKPSV